uniref:Helitron_like_N domain-containing protein n=1 Tax=Macrostomum lignano TaxID=282301 RepID=A0A1I8I3V1_9PLAT
MPKRGSISRSTRAASAAKKRRASETPEERQHRLEAQRQRTAESREAEDETVHQHRLEAQRQRQNQIRAAESADDRDRRLNAQADWRRDSWHTSHMSSVVWTANVRTAARYAGKTSQLAFAAMLERPSWSPAVTPPDVLKRLLTGQHPDSSQFLKDIRKYNGALHMTSLGAKQREQPGWNPSFILHGQMHHRIGSLLPDPGNEARFCQVFFVDQELQTRLQWATGLNGRLLEELQAMLHACNGYVCSLKSAVDLLRNDPQLQSAKVVINPMPVHLGSMPDASICPSAVKPPEHICDTHRSYDPLEYVLLFPFGEDGWSIGLKQDRGITIMKYYAFMIQVRPGQFNSLHYGGRLFQQYLVDQAAKIESERLNYIRHWRLCLCEASETRLPAALRRLFAAILSHGDSSDPAKLWQEFSGELAGDLLHQGYSPEAAESEVLRELQKLLNTMGGAELPAYGLPEPHVQPDQCIA